MKQAHMGQKNRRSWNWCVVWIDVLQRNTFSKSSYDWKTILKWQSFCFWCNNVKKPYQISQRPHLLIHKAVLYAAKPKTGDGPYYLKSTVDYIKYLVTEMEANQSITGRTISTDCLYTSTDSTNWLLDHRIATVGTLQKGRSGIPSELFDTQNREIFSATFHFETEKKNICLTSYTVKTKERQKKSERKKHAIDDGKKRPK